MDEQRPFLARPKELTRSRLVDQYRKCCEIVDQQCGRSLVQLLNACTCGCTYICSLGLEPEAYTESELELTSIARKRHQLDCLSHVAKRT